MEIDMPSLPPPNSDVNNQLVIAFTRLASALPKVETQQAATDATNGFAKVWGAVVSHVVQYPSFP